MKILAVDTSSAYPSAAILAGHRIVAEVDDRADLGYSEHLFGAVDRMLGKSGLRLGDIDVFGAIRGPGSFTGIRVGMAAIEGFAFATRKPAVGISALAAMAWSRPPGPDLVVPLIDARHGKYYGAVYRRETDRLAEVEEASVRDAGAWLESVVSSGAHVIGPDPLDLTRRFGRVVSCARIPRHLARAMVDMMAAGHAEPIDPLYLLRTSAEEKLRATKPDAPTEAIPTPGSSIHGVVR